ncbi:MAG: hypothetical protein J6V89_01165 [Acetobacter sp.]|nr:hypothetical protein [Acetobacter sp.]
MPEEAQETFSDLRENTEVFLNNVLKRAQENLSKEFKKMFEQQRQEIEILKSRLNALELLEERRSFNDDMEVKA